MTIRSLNCLAAATASPKLSVASILRLSDASLSWLRDICIRDNGGAALHQTRPGEFNDTPPDIESLSLSKTRGLVSRVACGLVGVFEKSIVIGVQAFVVRFDVFRTKVEDALVSYVQDPLSLPWISYDNDYVNCIRAYHFSFWFSLESMLDCIISFHSTAIA